MAKKNDWIVYVEIRSPHLIDADVPAIRKLTKKKVETGPVGKEPYLTYMQWKFSDLSEATDLLTAISHVVGKLEGRTVTYLCVRKDLT
jgi:hypothetical protein